jgi:hypothetical protein
MPALHDTLVSIATHRLEDPEQFIKWSELLNNAERTGRIKRAKRSPLAYCLERFTQSAMTDDAQVSSDFRLYFKVDDEVMHIEWKNPHEANSDGTAEVPLPDWAFTFFEDENHAALLEPDNTEKLAEVLQQVYEHCIQEGYIDP